MADDQTPKIIVDDDWKSQAKAEKEKLKESAPASQDKESSRLPEKAEFNHLLEVMVTQALMYMGAFPDPQTGQAMVALDLAKFHIDLLGVLEEKTKGNLTEEEEKSISGILQELRLRFVEVSEMVAKAAAEGKLGQAAGPQTPQG